MFLLHTHPPTLLPSSQVSPIFQAFWGLAVSTAAFFCLLSQQPLVLLFHLYNSVLPSAPCSYTLLLFWIFSLLLHFGGTWGGKTRKLCVCNWSYLHKRGNMCAVGHIYIKEVTCVQLVIFTCKPDCWFSCHLCTGHLYNW